MTTRRLGTSVLLLAFLAFLSPAPGAAAEEAPGAAAYAQGEALLADGRIDEATEAFLVAARAAPQNATYVERATSLRRVQGMRRLVATQPDAPTWMRSAQSLHHFYLQNGLPRLALEIDRTAHEKSNDGATAALLAETYLALDQNVEATNLLAEHSGTSRDLAVLHGIALARLGMADAARQVGRPTEVPADASPALLTDLARLRALLGETSDALALLGTSFERTPAPALPSAKERVRASPDFRALASLPAFAETMKVESKVKTTCSGGSSCASCPLRGKCGGGTSR